jgi:hypothetical protein
MRKIYYDDFLDSDDEITDEEIIQDLDPENHNIDLDDPDSEEFNDVQDDGILQKVQPKTLYAALKDELKSKEVDRGSLTFTKDGVEYEGVPMLEINPNKFVFKLEPSGKLKSFLLSEIQVVV